ncbi:hypothetical protein Leryth_007135 [Lithospermum erythrorhizon]|nr:hypothetical protein Leryth_007135 [Lithospermum erythrorhizon]
MLMQMSSGMRCLLVGRFCLVFEGVMALFVFIAVDSSPNGQQFLSCKEAALFLKSHFALNNARQLIDQRGFSMPQVYDITSTRTVGGSSLAAELMYEKIPVSILPVSDLHGTGASFEEMDNLAEVQVHDLLKCFKCNLSFDEKDAYLQHVLTFHEQPSTKKIKFGRPVGEGVIIRDGKFECQFCHKVFEERRKYNGHVGVHVRNRETGDFDVLVAAIKSNESFTHEELVLHTATVNTSLELDGNTTLETVAGTVGSSCPSTMDTNQELALVTSQQPNMGSDNCEPSQPIEELKVEGAPDLDLNQNDVEGSRAKTEMMNIYIGKDKPNDDCALPMPNDITYLSGEQRAGFSLYEAKSNNISGLIAQADIAHNEIASSSEFFMQSLECFPEFDSGSNKILMRIYICIDDDNLYKGESGFFNDDTKLQNVTGFEELGLDDLEPFDMANGSEMAEEPSSMIVFNSEEMSLNMDDGHPLTTLCVWCRSEFRLEHIDSEAQSDTIGYMCPTCKDKISGLS